jgi:hypothetical protein
MTNEELDKLTTEEQLELLKTISDNYKNLDLPIVYPVYSNGKVQNEKQIKENFKKILTVITALWIANLSFVENASKNVISESYAFYNLVKKGTLNITVKMIKEVSKETITVQKWNKIINDSLIKREKKIKIKQVLNGNIKTLNKQLQEIIVNGYKTGKTKPQIAKQINQQLGHNMNKAKSIALTEINFHKSEAQLEATEGLKISKTWIHNRQAKEPRETHIKANGKTVIGRDSYFNVGGKKTKAPQHFGIPSEDINCHCTMRIEVID